MTLASQTQAPSPGLATLMVCDPDKAADAEACWQQIATTFVARAWRRPLTPDQSGRVVSLWQGLVGQSSHELALESLVQATLVSPNFLYRMGRAGVAGANGQTSLDDYDLAGRLSYFLWSSMPDQELLAAAQAGQLRTQAGLIQQVDRMIKDKKIQGLFDGFVAQWLETRGLDTAAPDPTVFPAWSPDLKAAMISEANLFFQDYFTNGQSIASMMAPDFGFVNDLLARHYGLDPPGNAMVVKVPLAAGAARRGLMGQGAWLTANSVQTRTSPVKRGRFILENFLCQHVAPPPPGIAPLPTAMTGAQMTQRMLLDQHTKDATCAGCHSVIDPPGFAVEIYDGIAGPRTTEASQPINATGVLGDKAYDGAMQLAAIVAADARFSACLSRQLYGYALGRIVGDADAAALAAIADGLSQGGGRLDTLIHQVVLSRQFTDAPSS